MNTKNAVGLTCAVLMTVTASAGTYYASPDGTGSGAQGDPCSLMDAVDKVNADQGGEIVLATGTYQEAEDVTGTRNYDTFDSGSSWLYSYYCLKDYPIVIRSASGNPEDVIIKGRRADSKEIRLFRIAGDQVTIRDVTLSGALESVRGGSAVFCVTANCGTVLDNCIIEDCLAPAGVLYRCNLRNSTVRGNVSPQLIYNCPVSNCTFAANYANARSATCVYGTKDYSVYDSTFLCNTNCGAGNPLDSGLVRGVSNVVRCAFIGNYIDNNRHARGCFSVANVIDCGFTNNVGSSSVVWNCGLVAGCQFCGHASSQYVVNNCSVSNCTFTANYANARSAACVYGTKDYSVYDSTFLCNTNSGAGNPLDSGLVCGVSNVVRCAFVGNYIDNNRHARACYSVANVIDCGFTNNIGGSSTVWNGGLVADCSFLEGPCASVVKNSDTAEHIVSNCMFTASRMSANGTGVVLGNAGTSVYDSTFESCTNSSALSGHARAVAIFTAKEVMGCRIGGCYSIGGYLIQYVNSVVNCRFEDNLSDFSGWIGGDSSGCVITNCLFAGNCNAGGYTWNGLDNVAELVNCTIAGNTTTKMLPIGFGTVRNSILVGNSPYDCGAVTVDHTFYGTAKSAPTVIGEGSRSGVTVADVKFRGENEKGLPPFALKPKSPARGAGQTLPGQSDQLDLAGHPRVAEGKNVDLGAYAYFPAPFGLMLMLK